MGGALLAHTLAGLLDGRRALTHPPCSFAPFSAAWTTASCCAASTRAQMAGKRVLLADDVRNTGKTFQQCAELVRAGRRHRARHGRDLRPHGGGRRTLGVPNYALAEYKAPENFAAGGVPDVQGRRADHHVLTHRDRESGSLSSDPARSSSPRTTTTTARTRRRSGADRPAVRGRRRIRRSSGSAPRRWRSGGSRACINTVRDARSGSWGRARRAYVRAFDPRAPHPELRAMVHRWTRGVDIVALLWMLRQMIERSGSIEGFFLEGYDAGRRRSRRRARQLFAAARWRWTCARSTAGVPEADRRLLLLSAPSGGQRLQAAEPVPALDGAPRRSRSRRVDARSRREADRAARHPRDPAGHAACALTRYTSPGWRWRRTSRRRCARSIRWIRCASISRSATSA